MQLRRSLAGAGLAARVAVAETTVDPWRDTPARVRAFKRLTGTRVRFLTGSHQEISQLWRALGVFYRRVPQGHPPDRDWRTGRAETFDVQHTDGVFVIDPRGHLRVALPGMPDVAALPRRLSALLNDEGRENERRPDSPWTAAQLLADLRQLTGQRAAATAPRAAGTPAGAAASTTLAPATTRAIEAHLRTLRGRPVIVDEWASWCAPCRLEAPLVARAAARFAGRVRFVGLNVNDAAPAARSFLARYPLGFASFSDPDGRTAAALGPFAGLPTTLFLDRHGHITFTHAGGYSDVATIEDDITRHALGR